MTPVWNRGVSWPGFGYTDFEKAALKSISEKCPRAEYYAWLALVVVFALNIFAIGGEKNMAETPAPLFFLSLALDLLAGLSLGFPLAMIPAAALVGRFFAVAGQALPDRPTAAHYFHKLWFQIARVVPMLSPALTALTSAYFLMAREER